MHFQHRLPTFLNDSHQGRFYVGAEGTRAPQIHLLPLQIQKLADRSDVISEVPKCSKILIFWSSIRPDPDGGAYSAPRERSPDPVTDGRGLAAPCQEPHPRSRPFRPPFYGSQGITR